MQTILKPAEVGEIAETLFQERIRPLIAPTDRDKFVLIDINSGAFVVGTDDFALEEQLLATYPDATMVLLRADGGPTGHFGWPMMGE